jgi:hypothetical protein
MDARDDGEVSKPSPGGSPRGQAAAPISSLNEAWFNALDKCVIDTPLSEAILPLMRNCFLGGAVRAVLLLQKGHGDQLAANIASFLGEEPQSRHPKPSQSGINLGRATLSHSLRLQLNQIKFSEQINLRTEVAQPI